MKYVLYAFLAYILYQFIFSFIIPVYKVSRKVKKGFREMHQRMQEQQESFKQPAQPAHAQPGPSTNKGDYIDFEEMN